MVGHDSSSKAILYALRMKPEISVREAAVAINRLERRIAERFPEVRWTFIEPDVED